MCRLTELLERSTIYGPIVRLACQPMTTLQQALPQSLLSKIIQIFSVFRGMFKKLASFWMIVVPIVLVGLYLAFNVFDTGPMGVITWLLLLLTLALAASRDDIKWTEQFTIIDTIVLLFFLSACISAGFSSYLKYSVVGVAKMSTFVAGYASFRIISVIYGNQKLFWNLLAFLVAGVGLFQSSMGLYQFTHHVEARATWVDPTINPELNLTRVFGTLKPANPNLLAGFLIPCLTAALGLVTLKISRLLDYLPSGNRKRILPALLKTVMSVGLVGIIFLTLVLTGSRGGFLALIGISLTLFGFLGHLLWNPSEDASGVKNSSKNQTSSKPIFPSKTLKTLWLSILIVSVIGAASVIAVSPQLRYRVTSIFAMRNDSSISYRLNVYNSVVRMIKDNPVIGIGPGNDTFKRVYGYYMVPGFNALGAYSVPLEITAEQGFIGLAIFLSLLMFLKIRTLYFLETSRPLSEKMIAILLFSGIVGSILYGIFDTIWYRPAVNLQFWLFVALLTQITKPIETSTRFIEIK